MSNVYYVYLLLDPSDYYKPFYVGKGSGQRMVFHLTESARGENRFKDNKIANIRKNGHEPVAMKWVENLDEETAYEIEAKLIARFGRRNIDPDGILTNICIDTRPPSALGRPQSEEIRKKIGDKQRGELNHRFGETFTEEQLAKRSQICKESGQKPPVRNGPMSEAQKRKIGEANRGKKRSPEICAKLSEQRRGRKRKPHSPETIEKIRQSNIGIKKRKRTEAEREALCILQQARWDKQTEVDRAIHGEKVRLGHIKKKAVRV